MNNLIERLRQSNDPAAKDAARQITTLSERVAAQQTVLDRAAGILVDAVESSGGIDNAQAERWISCIRGQLAEAGRTTAEHFLEQICERIAATAGIVPHTDFNPLTTLDQIRVVLQAQQRNAERLEWAVSVLWAPADSENRPHLVVRTKGTRAIIREFPRGITWLDAMDQLLNEETANRGPTDEAWAGLA